MATLMLKEKKAPITSTTSMEDVEKDTDSTTKDIEAMGDEVAGATEDSTVMADMDVGVDRLLRDLLMTSRIIGSTTMRRGSRL